MIVAMPFVGKDYTAAVHLSSLQCQGGIEGILTGILSAVQVKLQNPGPNSDKVHLSNPTGGVQPDPVTPNGR
jgi:hypothetical protein